MVLSNVQKWRLALAVVVLTGIMMLVLGFTVFKDSGGGKKDDPDDECLVEDNLDSAFEYNESNTIQIANNTSQQYLHVFLQVARVNPDDTGKPCNEQDCLFSCIEGCDDKSLTNKAGGWGSELGWGESAWDPLGALAVQELVVENDVPVTLRFPSNKHIGRIVPIKTKESDREFLRDSGDGASSKVVSGQQATLLEGACQSGVVFNSSAVDGANFAILYKYIGDTSKGNTCTLKGACDTVTLTDAGCPNPAKQTGEPTCDCVACGNAGGDYTKCNDTCNDADPDYEGCDETVTYECVSCEQNCRFNDASRALFKEPPKEDPAYEYWQTSDLDGGKPNYVDKVAPVKAWIGNSSNISDEDMIKYCTAMNGRGTFSTYCYDYDDLTSSPEPGENCRIRLVYGDLS